MKRKEFSCAYLFADGHAVVIYKEIHPRAGKIEWVEMFQHLGPDVQLENGRIVFHDETLFNLVRKAWWVSAKEKSPENGSEASKRLDVWVGQLKVGMGRHWSEYLLFHDMSILCGSYCYQPEVNERFEDVSENGFWDGHRITKVHRVVQQPQPAVIAA